MATLRRIPRKSGASAPQRITGINWSSPLARGLAACWIAAPSGKFVDVSGITGDASVLNATVTTLESSQLALSTSDNYPNDVTGAATAAWNSPSLTIAVWGRATGTGTRMIATRENTGTPRIFQFRVNDTSLDWITNITGTADTRSSTTNVNDNKLRLFVATYEDSVRTAVAVDGVVESEASVGGALITGSAPNLCLLDDNRNGADPWGTGAIGSIMMWSRGFSNAEIAALYAPATRWSMIQGSRVTYFIPAAAGGGAITDVPLTTFTVSPQAPTTLRSLISNVPTL